MNVEIFIMARKHDSKMTSRSGTTVNKAYLEKMTKNAGYQANEKKARQEADVEKLMLKDNSMRKKEYM